MWIKLFFALICATTLTAQSPHQPPCRHSHTCARHKNYPPQKKQATLSAVTYTLSGGRLGDNLMSYVHAKWISYLFKIPLLYKPFPHSQLLEMHYLEKNWDSQMRQLKFRKTVTFAKGAMPNIQRNAGILYIVPYFPECLEEHKTIDMGEYAANGLKHFEFPYFQVGWNNPEFKKIICDAIKPRMKLNLIELPADMISVALHVRKGTGVDFPLLHETEEQDYKPSQIYSDVTWPLRFCPDEYYIEQLRTISEHFPDKQLYVYLFTDDPNPTKIVEKYAEALNNPNIIFDSKKDGVNYSVLDDLFSMARFDCMIRPNSMFSTMASKLGNYKILISPVHYKWVGMRKIVDEVSVEIK